MLECCTDGVVLFMFGFFCRSDHPIEISRWVYVSKTGMIFIMCMCYSKGFHYGFQSGGGGFKEQWVVVAGG